MSQPPNWQPPGSSNPFADAPPGGQPPPGYVPGQPYPGQPYPGGYYPPPTPLGDDPAMRWVLPVGQSTWALFAGYLGLFALGCPLFGPFALLCGIMAIVEMKKNPRVSGWGRAITGIVLGAASTVLLLIFIVAVIAEAARK